MLIANGLGFLSFLFLMWYKLKEDYHYEKIFNISFVIIFSILVSLLLTNYFLNSYWFWILITFVSVAFFISTNIFKMKPLETFNSTVISLLPSFALYLLSKSILDLSLTYFIGFWIVALLIFTYFFLEANYRKFTWYKSGRVGFSGLIVAILFFTTRSIASFLYPSGPTFIGMTDLYISASFSFIFFLLLLNLSRNTN